MEIHAVNWLNDNITGVGTFFALLFFILTIINTVINIKGKIFTKIRNQTLEDEELRNLKESVNKLVNSVDTMSDQIKDINTHLVSTESKFNENINANTRKIEEIITPKIAELEAHVDSMESTNQTALDDIAEYNKLAIKTFITNEYRKWMKLGHIDIYQLSIIEDQYAIYEDIYHGNTFIADIMTQLRNLSTRAVIVDENGNDPINYFNNHPEMDPRNRNNRNS